MRKHPWVTGEIYHVYNRGVDKRDIFMSKNDLERFIMCIKDFNVVNPIGSLRDKYKYENIIVLSENNKPLVSIICYSFLPNHFHLILRQEADGGVSEFMKRVLGGYTKYFNEIYNRTGALFQGRFKSHLIDNEQYLLKIRPYANINHLIHDIPENRMNLVKTSASEYDSMNFDIVCKKEAEELLKFYGGNQNFKKECLEIINIIREERGKTSLLDEDFLP